MGSELLQNNRATYFPWQAKESIHRFVMEPVSASISLTSILTVIPKLEGIRFTYIVLCVTINCGFEFPFLARNKMFFYCQV